MVAFSEHRFTAGTVSVAAVRLLDLDVEELFGSSRKAPIPASRAFFFGALWHWTDMSLPEIARIARRGSHTTVIAAVERFHRMPVEDQIDWLMKVRDEVRKDAQEEAKNARLWRGARSSPADRGGSGR